MFADALIAFLRLIAKDKIPNYSNIRCSQYLHDASSFMETTHATTFPDNRCMFNLRLLAN